MCETKVLRNDVNEIVRLSSFNFKILIHRLDIAISNNLLIDYI